MKIIPLLLLLVLQCCAKPDCEIAFIRGWPMKRSDARLINNALLPQLSEDAAKSFAIDVILSAMENQREISPVDGKKLISGYRSHLASLEKRNIDLVSHFVSLKQRYEVKMGPATCPLR